ncbi:MAG: hypothetical protein ACLP2F_08980, partial [Steroidobacteraceae bacterium]
NAFQLRRRERTFPFSSVGARLGVADFLGALAMEATITPPLSAQNGNVDGQENEGIATTRHPF